MSICSTFFKLSFTGCFHKQTDSRLYFSDAQVEVLYSIFCMPAMKVTYSKMASPNICKMPHCIIMLVFENWKKWNKTEDVR